MNRRRSHRAYLALNAAMAVFTLVFWLVLMPYLLGRAL